MDRPHMVANCHQRTFRTLPKVAAKRTRSGGQKDAVVVRYNNRFCGTGNLCLV
jgi:hypothetical protein